MRHIEPALIINALEADLWASEHRASMWPLALWGTVIFVAGFVVGSLIAPVFLALSLPYAQTIVR